MALINSLLEDLDELENEFENTGKVKDMEYLMLTVQDLTNLGYTFLDDYAVYAYLNDFFSKVPE